MDYGCKNQHDAGIRYDQENNIVECYLKKLKADGDAKYWHESCNVESVCCGIEGVGGRWKIKKNRWEGYGDVMWNFTNSPFTQKELPVGNGSSPGNEYMKNLAYIAMLFADVEAKVYEYHNSADIDKHMEEMLRRGSAVVFSYTPTLGGGGHYNCIVTYRDTADLFLGHDPWKGCPHCKNGGLFEKYTREYLQERCRPRLLEIGKK
ncbi:MAG: hypothetical protein PQJ46_09485 [Spirochaetales bacterium]|nr:hypothetical protein [Spirochaetales bacterium]